METSNQKNNSKQKLLTALPHHVEHLTQIHFFHLNFVENDHIHITFSIFSKKHKKCFDVAEFFSYKNIH